MTIRALRNLNVVLRTLLPEVAAVNLFARPLHVTVPVHYVFGEQDALTPPAVVKTLPAAIAAPNSTVVRCPTPATWSISTSPTSCDQSWGMHEALRGPDRLGSDQDGAGPGPRAQAAPPDRHLRGPTVDRMASNLCLGHRPSGRCDRRGHRSGYPPHRSCPPCIRTGAGR